MAVSPGWLNGFQVRILDDFRFEIDAEEVFSRLRLAPHKRYADEIHALIERARPLARPRPT